VRYLLVALFFAAPALAETQTARQPLSSLRIDRGERSILVHQYAPSTEGGRFILRNPGCEDGVRLSTVYAPEPYLVETLVGEMLMTSRVVFERQPPEGQERSTLHLLDASVEFDEARCPQDVQPTGEPNVTILEGNTTVRGGDFRYDNATGLGVMEGPVALAREGEEPLTARAERMEVSIDDDRTLLKGGVVVEQGERVSEAEEFEYDEAAAFAVLRGNEAAPARSREGEEVIAGQVIEYDLDSGDVVAVGGVRGSFQIDR
jgi:lipopolysaccharide export system protein LptA